MAIAPKDEYPGQTITGDAGYPQGKARNVSVLGDGSGTPWEERLINDVFGFQQALLDEAGITPSGTPDSVTASQYLDALSALFAPAGAITGDSLAVTNFITGGSDVTAGGEFLYSSPKSRTIRIPVVSARENIASDSVGSTLIKASGYPQLRLQASLVSTFVDITDHLPDGATLQSVKALVQPGAARTVGNRVTLRVAKADLSAAFSTPDMTPPVTVVGSQEDDGTTSAQTIDVTSLAHTVDKADGYFLEVQAGDNAGTNEDILAAFEITFDDPGPRNI